MRMRYLRKIHPMDCGLVTLAVHGLSWELPEGQSLLSSLAFLFVFVQDKAKAINTGRTESHVPTVQGSGTPGLSLPSRRILLSGISRNQCQLKKVRASKTV